MVKSFLSVIFLTIFIAFPYSADAGCNPADDPCAKPKALDSWDKSLSFGFNLTQGNSETTLLTILGRASKETKVDLWNFDLAYNFGEDKNINNENGDDTTRNDVKANLGYRYLLSDTTYVGPTATFRYDEIADIDYQVAAVPVVGYYLVKNDDIKLALEVGPGYLFEKVGGESNDYFAPKVGDRFDWIISCTSKIYQAADVLFDTDDTDNYIVNAEAGIETAISTNLGLVVGVREQYDNRPAAGREKDDLMFLTALKVAL